MCNISLSFDDSKRNFYTNVFPLLKKYNIPATLNIITERVRKSKADDEDRPYMTIAEVQECAASGVVEIASHSANHRNEVEDVVLSLNHVNDWNTTSWWGGGYASPFSELSVNNLREKGFEALLRNGELKYIRSGTRTRREGVLFAAVQFANQYLHSPLLYWTLNKKFVISRLSLPFLPSVAVHHDTTVKMLSRFVEKMHEGQSVVFCLHGILKPGEKDYDKRFNWDYDRFEQFLRFLSGDDYKVMTTTRLVDCVIEK